MKDLLLTAGLVLLVMALFIAAPIAGIIIGVGGGFLFLLYVIKEDRKQSKE